MSDDDSPERQAALAKLEASLRMHPRDFVWERTELHPIAAALGIEGIALAMSDPAARVHTRLTIPAHMHGAIMRYLTAGLLDDEFLEAIVTNNLERAFRFADPLNEPAIRAFIAYFYNETPSACWGSVEKVSAWIASFREPETSDSASAPSVKETE